MKRHVFGTFLLGATVTWLLSYAVHLAGFTDLAYVVAAFFGAITYVATVTDYLELKQRQEYDAKIEPVSLIDNLNHQDLPDMKFVGSGTITYVGTSEEDIPDEVREIIEKFIENNAAPAAVVKVTKMESVHKVEPQLSKEELAEIEEKFS